MNYGIRKLAPYRILISRTVIGCCLISLVFRGLAGILPNQLQHPILTNFHYDLTMWSFKLSGLAYYLTQVSWIGNTFVALLLITGIFSFLFPLVRWLTIPFSILFFLLAINFNFYLTHNSHYLAGFIWILFVLWPQKGETFEIFWDGLRYYICWIYGVAFLYKIIHGAFFQWEAGVLTSRENMVTYIYQNPETFATQVYNWFFNHPFLLNIGHKIVALAEGFFIIGFFTKRFDIILIFLMFFIFASVYFFADVFFVELLILSLTFLPSSAWQWVSRNRSIIKNQ